MRLFPLLCLIYAPQCIDKTTLSYAAVFGLEEDLHLKDTEISWRGALFYLGYLGLGVSPKSLSLEAAHQLLYGRDGEPSCPEGTKSD
jgi:hypothetical protein